MSKTYTTIQGDMWDLISLKVYGSEQYMTELLEANESYKEVAVFPAGITLICPEVKAVTSKMLPPWRR